MGRSSNSVCSCLFSQSFMSPTKLFTLTSSENIMHQAAREKQQGKFTASFYLLSSPSCFIFACAFSRGQNSSKKNQGKFFCFSFNNHYWKQMSVIDHTFGNFKSIWNFSFFPIITSKFTLCWAMALAWPSRTMNLTTSPTYVNGF